MDDYLDFFDNLGETFAAVYDVKVLLTFSNIFTFTSSNCITLKNLLRKSLFSKFVNLDLEELLTESASNNLGRNNRYASVQNLKQSRARNINGCF